MKKLSMFLVVGMGLYGSLLIACGDDDEVEVPCADDAECAAKCTEGDAATCVDGICDGCTLPTVDCTADGTECADGCEEGADATCNADTLTCDGCTPKSAGDDDDDTDSAGCTTDADCEATPETPTCEIPADAEEGATGTCVAAAPADPFSCEGKADADECGEGDNMGACDGGKCMGSKSSEVTINKAGTTGGDCVIWGDEGGDKDSYKYDGNKMDNADCILGVSNGDLWWAGPAGSDLKIDNKAIDQDATKLSEAATDGDHTAEWGGKSYSLKSSHSGDAYTLTFSWDVEVMAAE